MSVQKAVKSSHYEAESNMEHDIVRKAWIFKPSGLNFIWGGDSRYWVIPKEDRTPAELKMVSWLEVTGSFDKIEPGKTYRIGFKISFTGDATGWDQAPVFMSAKIGKKGKTSWKRIKSVNNNIEKLKGGTQPVNIPDETDGIFEIFVSPKETINQETKLQFGLYEVWTGKWKKDTDKARNVLQRHETLTVDVVQAVKLNSITDPEFLVSNPFIFDPPCNKNELTSIMSNTPQEQ